MSDRDRRRVTPATVAFWLACLAVGVGIGRAVPEDLAAPVIATAAPYPIGQPGATPIAWPSPTSSVPTAVPITTPNRRGAWVNCRSRMLEAEARDCSQEAPLGYGN